MPQRLHQKPRAVAAGPGTLGQGFFAALHARFHADDIADQLLKVAIEADQEIDGPAGPPVDSGQEGIQLRAERFGHQERFQFLA